MNTCQFCESVMEHSHLCAKIQRLQAQADAKNDLRTELHRVALQNDRLKNKLNEIRGKAFQEAFSGEPSNFAALVLKIIEDDYTEKEKCKHKRTEPAGDDMVFVCMDCKARVL